MMKNHCKNPKCINNAIPGKEYCKKHEKEIKQKSKEYLEDMK